MKVAKNNQGVRLDGKPTTAGKWKGLLTVTDSAGSSLSQTITFKIR